MKRHLRVLVVGLWLPVQAAWATHIVGGELQLTLKDSRSYTYTLALNLYFDVVNGQTGAEDASVNVSIFSRRTNRLMRVVTLPRVSRELVPYTNPACVNEQLITRLIRYEDDISLGPDTYGDAGGYYAVWERCCRNVTIVNIQDPQGAGNSFYLEFPAVRAAGRQFNNSSPVFAMPKGDYACVNRPFVFEFGATDADGDELRYSLVTPFTGYSTAAAPRPPALPGPYPTVRWANGISLNNVIPGPQPLQVNPRTGQLRVTANRTGLYVFSVRCEEFRAGAKIGEVRRDFQLLVVDCPSNEPPIVELREKGKPDNYREGDVLLLRAQQTDRCMDLLLTDASNRENVQVRIRPLNFPANVVAINPASGLIRDSRDTLRSQLCWSACAASEPGKPYEFEVILQDDGCPLPLADTLRVRLIVEPVPNQQPAIRTTLPGNAAVLLEGNTLNFSVIGADPDNDQITVEAFGRGFDLRQLGMAFTTGNGRGTVTTPFVWQPPCDRVREGQEYLVDFVVTDRSCPNILRRDTVTVRLRYQSRPNQQPEITTTLAGNAATLEPNQSVQFDVTGADPDNNTIVVTAAGRGFSLEEAGMQFRNNATGVGRLTEPFAWTPGCEALQLKADGVFVVDFVLRDNTCAPNRTDTVSVQLTVKDREYTIPADSVPNVFTPNGDNINETFEIFKFLPPDNCADAFVKLEICNRWGKVVFASTSRERVWTGFGFPPGVYYYVVQYRKATYRGTVSVLQ